MVHANSLKTLEHAVRPRVLARFGGQLAVTVALLNVVPLLAAWFAGAYAAAASLVPVLDLGAADEFAVEVNAVLLGEAGGNMEPRPGSDVVPRHSGVDDPLATPVLGDEATVA